MAAFLVEHDDRGAQVMRKLDSNRRPHACQQSRFERETITRMVNHETISNINTALVVIIPAGVPGAEVGRLLA
jgi:hypothetical protein